MLKRPTISERSNPPITAATIAAVWNAALINQLLGFLWSAYDTLHNDVLKDFDWSQPSDDVERELTEKLFARLQRQFDMTLPVYPMHAVAERESRPNPPGQPPMYDIAFVLHANDRICWPVEAKIIKSDKDTGTNLGDYTDTFNNRIMTFRYAPFSTSGSILAYLKSGDPNAVLDHLESRLSCVMIPNPDFPNRVHRTSDHLRSVPQGKPYLPQFRCHHLVLSLGA